MRIKINAIKIRILEKVKFFKWRWLKNFSDTCRHLINPYKLDSQSQKIVNILKVEGIADGNGLSDTDLLIELQIEASKKLTCVWDELKQCPQDDVLSGIVDRSHLVAIENKDFLVVLTPKVFSPTSIFLRYALQPSFIRIANSYLGLNSQLRSVQLWLNYATHSDASSTQLWHRDGDDFLNLKIFTYLSDVDENHGPFTYIPGTQPLGPLNLTPLLADYHRTSDLQMASIVDPEKWQICNGIKGSIILADTCGYHKGMKPKTGYRLMLMAHYTSRSAVTGNDINLSEPISKYFSREQINALG